MKLMEAGNFSELLAEYEVMVHGKDILNRIFPQKAYNMDVHSIIGQYFIIQSAICELVITGKKQANIWIPKSQLKSMELSDMCQVFEKILTTEETVHCFQCQVSGIKPLANDIFIKLIENGLIHPLLTESYRNFKTGLQIHSFQKTVFMEYSSHYAFQKNKLEDDLFLAALQSCSGKGFLFSPALMYHESIETNPLIRAYGGAFDKLVFVGSLEKGRFLSHALVGFYSV